MVTVAAVALALAAAAVIALGLTLAVQRLTGGRSDCQPVEGSEARRNVQLERATVTPIPQPSRPAPKAARSDTRSKPAPGTRAEQTPSRRPPRPFTGRVWVIDGDTITVCRQRIRLFGMDAPELGQRGGSKAKSKLISLTRGRDVRIEPLCMDIYDRIVAKVWCGDVDLSEAMVREGFAVATSRYNRDYLPAEREARQGRRGLWAEDRENGIGDPAAFRRWKASQPQPRPAVAARRPWLH